MATPESGSLILSPVGLRVLQIPSPQTSSLSLSYLHFFSPFWSFLSSLFAFLPSLLFSYFLWRLQWRPCLDSFRKMAEYRRVQVSIDKALASPIWVWPPFSFLPPFSDCLINSVFYQVLVWPWFEFQWGFLGSSFLSHFLDCITLCILVCLISGLEMGEK